MTLMAATFFAASPSTDACTNIQITAKDGSIINARSMEFGEPFASNLRSSPRGRMFTTLAPDGKPGLSWKAKYGYVFLDGMNIDVAVDGMNEVGLSFGALLFPHFAKYADLTADHDSQALPYMNIGDWILSNFKTVDEVRNALPNIYIFLNKLPGLGDATFPLHYVISDASGKGIVVEYVDGKMHIYDSLGVMTNSPSYDWHVTNLTNYLHLTPTNPAPVKADGQIFAATGQGYGMIGLPGDISPPSRFVKSAVLMKVAIPADNAAGALNLAQHIMNNVDIPFGEAREPSNGNYFSDVTQWVVFKDLTNKVFYYRTYDDMTLHGVSLSKVDFSENAARMKMPITSKQYVNDMTDQFLKSKG